MVAARFFASGFDSREPAIHAAARARLVATDPDGYVGCCQAIASADLRDQIGEVHVPALVIGGAEDPATPPSDAEWLHSQIAGSRLVILAGAGHVSNLEQPDAFNEALVEFLSEVS
jgi:3-oxoadipate enol-lactonase